MSNKKVSDLVNELESTYAYKPSQDRIIQLPEVNRVGLELVGFRDYAQHKRIMIIGNKEIAFLKTMEKQAITEAFQFLLTEQTPCIIVTRGNTIPDEVKEVATKKEVSIINWNGSTSRLLLRLFDILDEWFAPSQLIYGTLMSIYGIGVLIKGPSGIGKSEIALELMKKGHTLVSDDSVQVKLYDNTLVGSAPPLIQNMIEIRGVGILDVTQLFGHRIITEQADIDFIVELSKWDKDLKYERVGTTRNIETILGVDIVKITLPVSEGRSMSEVIEVSVINFKLQEKGINSAELFAARIENQLKEKK
ncbi:HPr(Ser) kinase/phosphatase [Mycoplasma sp. P36-A1]|uniref:HPr(Ser) kinase/phosphatase n=1 Tax=Mycoplasma sp. P36-A1 TaxID=3252900 RepID=UPI003C2DBD34